MSSGTRHAAAIEVPSPTRSGKVRVALVTNVPAPYRVPAMRLLAADPSIELDVVYCAPPHIDTTLDAAAHGFEPVQLRGRYRAYGRRFMHADPGVIPVLRRLRPHVVITTGYIPTFLLAFAWARSTGAAHIAMTDGTADSERNFSGVHRALRRLVLARSAACLGASEGSFSLFREYGVPRRNMFKAPLAVDNARFEIDAEPPQVDFLFCGRLLEFKGCGFALEVARATADKLGRPVSLDYVGAGDFEDELRRQARTCVDSVRARFLGYASQQELPGRYAAARVLLFPSRTDTWGVVANEACAAARPVLISPHAGAAGELVLDGDNGFVLPLQVDSWAAAAAALHTDETLWRHMGQRGRQRVQAYSFEAAARGIADAVKHATQRA